MEMLVIKSTIDELFRPKYAADIPMFMHCCDGKIAVGDIFIYMPIFNSHNIQIMVQDETLNTTTTAKE